MKKEIIGAIGIVAAIILAFVINASCAHTNYTWKAQMCYLVALFLFHTCWCAMCVTEKRGNDIFSVIGANLGLPMLIFCVVIAFMNGLLYCLFLLHGLLRDGQEARRHNT